MMGDRLVTQESLFYQFRLDDHIPADHMLRAIDRFVDLDGLRRHLAPFYSTTGRPSIDPELMIRMLLVGYCFGIRSERRLCEEVHLNLGYRWFCRLGLDGAVPDHSTFSKNRHGRFRDSDAFRHVFETVVSRCIEEKLVGGEGFAVDASLIAADANKQRSISGAEHTICPGANTARATTMVSVTPASSQAEASSRMSISEGWKWRMIVAATTQPTASNAAASAIRLPDTTNTAATSTRAKAMPNSCAGARPAACIGPTANKRMVSMTVNAVSSGSPYRSCRYLRFGNGMRPSARRAPPDIYIRSFIQITLKTAWAKCDRLPQ